MLGLLPCKGAIAYDVSKAALDMVTKQFALELGLHQVRVNSVNLTVVKTEKMVERWEESPVVKNFIAMTPMGRLCSLKDCTGAIKYLLSDHSTMVSGTTQVVDGGLLSHIPV